MSTPETKSPQQLQVAEDVEKIRNALLAVGNGLVSHRLKVGYAQEALARLPRLQERAEATERAERERDEELRGSDASHKALDAFRIERTSGSGETPPSAVLNVTQRIQRLGERRARLAQLLSSEALQRVEEAPNPASPALQACVPARPQMGFAEFVRAVLPTLGGRPLASMPHLEAIAEHVERGGQVSIAGGRPYQRRAMQDRLMAVMKHSPGPSAFTFKPYTHHPVRQALDGAYLVLDRVEDEEERARWKPVLEMLEAAVGPARPPLSGKPADVIIADDVLEATERLDAARVQALAESMLPEATPDEVVALAREALALRAARRLLTWLGMMPAASIIGPADVVLHQVEELKGPYSYAMVRWLAVEVLEDRCHRVDLEEQLREVDRQEVEAVARLLLEALRVGMTGRHVLQPTTLPTWEKLDMRLQGALRVAAGAVILRALRGDLPLSMSAARQGADDAR